MSLQKWLETVPTWAQFFLGLLSLTPLVLIVFAGYLSSLLLPKTADEIISAVMWLLMLFYIIAVIIYFRNSRYLLAGFLYLFVFIILFIYWYLVGEMLDPTW